MRRLAILVVLALTASALPAPADAQELKPAVRIGSQVRGVHAQHVDSLGALVLSEAGAGAAARVRRVSFSGVVEEVDSAGFVFRSGAGPVRVPWWTVQRIELHIEPEPGLGPGRGFVLGALIGTAAGAALGTLVILPCLVEAQEAPCGLVIFAGAGIGAVVGALIGTLKGVQRRGDLRVDAAIPGRDAAPEL